MTTHVTCRTCRAYWRNACRECAEHTAQWHTRETGHTHVDVSPSFFEDEEHPRPRRTVTDWPTWLRPTSFQNRGDRIVQLQDEEPTE